MSHLPVVGAAGNLKVEDLRLLQPLAALRPAEHLDLRLHCAGPGRLGPEPVDELLQLLPLPLVVDARLFVYLFFLEDLLVELLRRSRDLSYAFAVDGHDVGCHAVHERPVMGDEDQFGFPLPQEPAEPSDRDDIQVVGGLVEQQEVGLRDEHLCEVEPDLEAARKLHGGPFEMAFREAEAEKDALHLVGFVRPVLAPRQRQAGLPEHAPLREEKSLGEIAHGIVPREIDASRIGLFLARDQSQQRGFPASVPAHETHALPFSYRERDVLEDDLRAVGLCQIGN